MDWYLRVGPGDGLCAGIGRATVAVDALAGDSGQSAEQPADASASADGNAGNLASTGLTGCQCPGRFKRGLPCREDCPKRISS